MKDCLFCKIIAGEIPSNKIYEDDFVYAFYDVDPKAPVHVLIVPKVHLENQMDPLAVDMAPHLFAAAQIIARKLDIAKDGFRTVINTGLQGGQTVGHLHMHLLAGRQMAWPPG